MIKIDLPEEIIEATIRTGPTTSWIQLYPNPAPVSFQIKNNDGLGTTTLMMYDMSGKIILENAAFHAGRDRINVLDFPNGTYLVVVVANGNFYTEKLVVSR